MEPLDYLRRNWKRHRIYLVVVGYWSYRLFELLQDSKMNSCPNCFIFVFVFVVVGVEVVEVEVARVIACYLMRNIVLSMDTVVFLL